MHDSTRIHCSQRNVLLTGVLFLLIFGASRVFSRATAPATTPANPQREILLLRKAALEAEMKAVTGRLTLANHRIKNAEAGGRTGFLSDDFQVSANVDFLEQQAVLARKRAELKEVTNRLEGPAGTSPQEGSLIDVTDDLLRRIRDLEARVDQIEATARERRLRSSAITPRRSEKTLEPRGGSGVG